MDLTDSSFSSKMTDNNEKSNNVISQKMPVKAYATKVFQDSTIGMVSNIVTTHSKYRRFLKVSIFSLCFLGFLYQSITFLNHVFEHPTTLNINVDRPKSLIVPAYTFCTNNP